MSVPATFLNGTQLADIRVADIEDHPKGLVVVLPKSKTDQEGKTRRIALPPQSELAICPVHSLNEWLTTAGGLIDVDPQTPVFRAVDRHGKIRAPKQAADGPTGMTPAAIARVIKRACLAAGLDPARYSGHSLRSGFVTDRARKGISAGPIMAQTGHTSERMIANYTRNADPFEGNAAAMGDRY